MAGTNLGVRRETDAGEFPYSCAETLRRDFVAGLERLLRDESGLGPYILVLNNALIDAGVAQALGAELAQRFEVLAAGCLEAAAVGAELARAARRLVGIQGPDRDGLCGDRAGA